MLRMIDGVECALLDCYEAPTGSAQDVCTDLPTFVVDKLDNPHGWWVAIPKHLIPQETVVEAVVENVHSGRGGRKRVPAYAVKQPDGTFRWAAIKQRVIVPIGGILVKRTSRKGNVLWWEFALHRLGDRWTTRLLHGGPRPRPGFCLMPEFTPLREVPQR
jgi:hypothetical protein